MGNYGVQINADRYRALNGKMEKSSIACLQSNKSDYYMSKNMGYENGDYDAINYVTRVLR